MCAKKRGGGSCWKGVWSGGERMCTLRRNLMGRGFVPGVVIFLFFFGRGHLFCQRRFQQGGLSMQISAQLFFFLGGGIFSET